MTTRAWDRAEDTEPLERFVDLLQMAAGMVDAGGALRYANAAWTAISGGEADSEFADLAADSDRCRLTTLLDHAVGVGRGQSAEPAGPTRSVPPVEARLRNGRWAQLHIQTLDGVKDGWWLCTVVDIHDLHARHDFLEASSGLQATLLDASPDCIKLLDLDGRIAYMNDAGCRALHIEAESGFGQLWVDLMPPSVRERGAAAVTKARSGQTARFSGHTPSASGPVEWDNLLTPTLDEDGQVTSILCVARNVTEERAAQQALADSQERLAMASLVGGLGIWDFELASNKLFCDATWHAIMGLPEGTVTSMEEFQPLIHPEDVAHATEVQHTAAHLIETGEDYTNTFRIIRPTGEIRWVKSAACLIQDENDEPFRAIGFILDITDSLRGQRALEDENRSLHLEREKLSQESAQDALTGLANRRVLTTELARLAAARATSTDAASVLMVDIDHFKAYNDRDGHLEGDAALIRLSQCLRDVIGPDHLAARFGGDEFVVLLPGVADPEPILTRLFALLADSRDAAASPAERLTISCGCAVFAAGVPVDVDTMLHAADQAMYVAKARGRNQFVIDWHPLAEQ